MLGNNIQYKPMIINIDVLIQLGFFNQCPLYFKTSDILMMQYSVFRMSALFASLVVAIMGFIKPSTPFYYLINPVRAFYYHQVHHIFIAQTITSHKGVFYMFSETVFLCVIHHRYTTLCILCVGFVCVSFCEYSDTFIRKLPGNFHSKCKPCNT